ncbi:MAG: Rpn family recombination-promoting nuclease/putative transposase, partial [Defluviitaleaceae bacterium]|nr:Rpn family recombination-promoting nuclease/putative transposase [Defluviitaleaceae bacterium]
LPPDADILSPVDDHIFKTLMTHPEAKPVLIDVLSSSMNRNVTDAAVRNNELPISDDNEKGERFDVNCIIDHKDHKDQADVEMHGSHIQEVDDSHTSFINKYMYYLTDLHSSQPSKGKKYHELARTYQIAFCNYTIYPNRKDYITRSAMRTEDGELVTDQINFILVELSKLDEILKKPVDKLTPLEMWSIFFKFAPDVKRRDVVNKVIAEKGEIAMAGALLMEISQDEHQRAKYRSRRMFEHDKFHNEATAEERGGNLAMLKVARSMKAAGEPTSKITQHTGLTAAEVEKA